MGKWWWAREVEVELGVVLGGVVLAGVVLVFEQWEIVKLERRMSKSEERMQHHLGEE